MKLNARFKRQITTAAAAVAMSLIVSPAFAQCAGGETKLPLSGLCSGEAASKLGKPGRYFTEGLKVVGCKAVVAEASFMGGEALLYWAAQCGGAPTQMVAEGGAHQGGLFVTGGGSSPAGGRYQVATIIGADEKNSPKGLLNWTRDDMRSNGANQTATSACKAFRAAKLAKDAWVVDAPNGYLLPNGTKVRDCGRYGYLSDARSYWRVFGQLSWHFDLGQDAFSDFDASTMMLVPAVAGAGNSVSTVPATGSGTFNIAGDPRMSEQFYDTARKYTVFSGGDRSRVQYCVAERNFGGSVLRLGYDGGQWQLAVPYGDNPNYDGTLEIDGRSFFTTGTAANGWTFVWLGLQELEAIRAGSKMILNIGRASLDFTLDGTTAAGLKVEECVQRLR